MRTYRILVLFLVVAVLTAVPISANQDTPRTTGADIVRMWDAKVSSDTIILFVRQSASDVVLTAEDIAMMAEAGLPDRFIRDLVKAAGNPRGRRASYPLYAPPYDPYYYGYNGYYRSPYPWWFYGGGIDLHLGGGFGRHHYSSFRGHGLTTIGHGGGLVGHRDSGRSHAQAGLGTGSGHSRGGSHARSSSGGHSSGGHSSGGGHGRGH